MTKPQNPRKQTRRLWSPKEEAVMRKLYADTPTAELARRFDREIGRVYAKAKKLGLCKSAEFLDSNASGRLRPGSTVGLSGRYPKGHVPANKGLRRPGWHRGRMKETQFKKGSINGWAQRVHRPIGTILADHEGYLRIKIAERVNGKPAGWHPSIWPLLHRRNWEKLNGPVPPGHILVFRDRDRSNCDPSNLELITIAENMRRNTRHNLPPEINQVIQLRGALNRVINRRERQRNGTTKQDVGSSRPSV